MSRILSSVPCASAVFICRLSKDLAAFSSLPVSYFSYRYLKILGKSILRKEVFMCLNTGQSSPPQRRGRSQRWEREAGGHTVPTVRKLGGQQLVLHLFVLSSENKPRNDTTDAYGMPPHLLTCSRCPSQACPEICLLVILNSVKSQSTLTTTLPFSTMIVFPPCLSYDSAENTSL